MADDIHQRLSAEGADPLLFAGVNDANLLELQRTLGVRVSFRGDAVTVTGAAEQLERATPVVQGLLDLARMGEPVTPDDVFRLAAEGPTGELAAPAADGKIVLPGLRRAIVAQDAGPARLPAGDRLARHRRRDRAGRHRQDLSGGGQGGGGARQEAGQADHTGAAGRRGGRVARLSARATSRQRSIPTFGRCTTRSRT